jgi:hypothetical protein
MELILAPKFDTESLPHIAVGGPLTFEATLNLEIGSKIPEELVLEIRSNGKAGFRHPPYGYPGADLFTPYLDVPFELPDPLSTSFSFLMDFCPMEPGPIGFGVYLREPNGVSIQQLQHSLLTLDPKTLGEAVLDLAKPESLSLGSWCFLAREQGDKT